MHQTRYKKKKKKIKKRGRGKHLLKRKTRIKSRQKTTEVQFENIRKLRGWD